MISLKGSNKVKFSRAKFIEQRQRAKAELHDYTKGASSATWQHAQRISSLQHTANPQLLGISPLNVTGLDYEVNVR